MKKIVHSIVIFLFTLPLFLAEVSAEELKPIRIHEPPILIVSNVCFGETVDSHLVRANEIGMYIVRRIRLNDDGCHYQVSPFRKIVLPPRP